MYFVVHISKMLFLHVMFFYPRLLCFIASIVLISSVLEQNIDSLATVVV